MVRFLALVVVALLLFLVLRASAAGLLAGLRGPARRQALRDELVKDPVCETYIPRRKAIARNAGAVTYFFCSAACADRFTTRS